MKEEEKIVSEEPLEAPESEFADEAIKAPEAKIEETPAEVPAPVEEAKKEEGKNPLEKEEPKYVYDDPCLANIEAARATFDKAYASIRKWSFIPTLILIIAVLAVFIIPSAIEMESTWQLTIMIVGVVVIIAIMLVLSFFKRKKTNELLKDYFNKFYAYTNEFVFHGTGITNVEGTIDTKLAKEEFEECGLYKDVFSVGSRASLVFNYGGKKCGIADAAAQVRGQKSAVTVYVGKYFRSTNVYHGDTITIYLKGNDRALPPTNVGDLPVISDDKEMTIYGTPNAKKAINKDLKAAIKAIKTDATLVDVTIRIEEGKTFVLLGYEDTLMVLPLEHAFNPAPTEHFRTDMKKVLALVDAIDTLKGIKTPAPVEKPAEPAIEKAAPKAEETAPVAEEAAPAAEAAGGAGTAEAATEATAAKAKKTAKKKKE